MKQGQTVGGTDGGMSVFEIAEEMGCSPQRASFLVAKAMAAFKLELLRRGYRFDDFVEKYAAKNHPPHEAAQGGPRNDEGE